MSNITDKIPAMLTTAQHAWQRGNRSSALAVVRMLLSQYPEDERVRDLMTQFEGAAQSAMGDGHRTAVLPELQSTPPLAATPPTAITARLPELYASESRVEAEPHSPIHDYQAEEHRWSAVANVYEQDAVAPTSIRWPMYLIMGFALAIILLTVLWRWTSTARPAPQVSVASITPGFVPINTLIPTLPTGMEPGSLPLVATVEPAPATLEPPTRTFTPAPTETPSPTSTPQPTITPRPVLTQGQVVQSASWRVSLLRPDHAMVLDGAIGALQPKGRFVLALLSVGYTGEGVARVPASLVMLEDDQGRMYQPEPGASNAYLDTFGRGQYGDISLDEDIPPDAGNLSIPFIFDVPEAAHQLHIVVMGQNGVWVVP